MIGIPAAVVVLIVAPLVLGLVGVIRARRSQGSSAGRHLPWRWDATWASALLYTLAFNVTFFIQELFLVVPKAFTPGRPVLYHNNHGWTGDHPRAELFQGTGALAILITASLCALILRTRDQSRPVVTLFLIWMAFHGSVQALLQVVVAAVNPRSDVGRAFGYLEVNNQTQWTAAWVAVAAIPAVALFVTRLVLTLADARLDVADARARARFVAQVATVPGVLAIPLIIAFRVPRELVEVVAPPIVVTVVGMSWMQAFSWHGGGDVRSTGGADSLQVAYPLGAVLALLLIFHVVLRPGVRFF